MADDPTIHSSRTNEQNSITPQSSGNDGDEPFPVSPPEPDPSRPDLQVPRKREREISLEPLPTLAATVEADTGRKEIRAPAKKNRLDATEEEEHELQDEPGSANNIVTTPPRSRTPSRSRNATANAGDLPTSPPVETKIRHISRRVEDINWRSDDGANVVEMDVQLNPELPNSAALEAAADIEQVPAYVEPDTQRAPTNHEVEVPARTQEQRDDVSPTTETMSTREERRRSTDSIASISKRPRDDADKDANPRETKRPSPPPDSSKNAAPAVAPVAPSTPASGGFAAFASTSSPFASVKGPNIFGSTSKPKPAFGAPSTFGQAPAAASPFGSSSSASPFGSSSHMSSPFRVPSRPSTPQSQPGPNDMQQTPQAMAQPPTQTPMRNPFEAFASVTSPFASVSPSSGPSRPKSPLGRHKSPLPYGERPKSPVRRGGTANSSGASLDAFSSYASGGATPLSGQRAKAAKREKEKADVIGGSEAENGGTTEPEDGGADEDSEKEDKPVSFGERLRAGGGLQDEEEYEGRKKMDLEEREVTTGEEDEETLYQVRGKLFVLSQANQWKERGTGSLRLNVRREDGHGARLVMRKEAVYSLLLNIALFPGMHFALAQDPRYLRFSAIEEGSTTHYNLRVSNAKIAAELLEEIRGNVPTA